MKKAVILILIVIIAVLAVAAIFIISRRAQSPASSELSRSFIQFYKLLDQKILTHDVDEILKQHDELLSNIIGKKTSDEKAVSDVKELSIKLENAAYNPPKHLNEWRNKKLVPTEGKTYFGNWHLRSFLLSKEYQGADSVFAKMAEESKKVLISYIDVPIQDPAGDFQNMNEPVYWITATPLPPPTLMMKAQLRRGAIPAIQLHLFDMNSEGWMKEQVVRINKEKQFDATDVANGEIDDYLKRQIEILNKIDYPIVLLFVNEFNIYSRNLFGESGKELYTEVRKKYGEEGLYNQYGDPKIPDGPERVKDAWIKIKNIMNETGASSHISLASHTAGGLQNKSFATPGNLTPFLEDWNHLENYWPGERVIDYIGMSAYGFILTKNKDEMSLYGSTYYWWQEIKNSSWRKTPTFFNEFAPLDSDNFPGGKDPNYMPKYLKYALGDIIPNDYPVSFVLLITPSNVYIDPSEEAKVLSETIVNNDFYADSVKLK